MSAASTPPPSATIQTFEPSLAGVAALGASTTSSTRATGSLASSPLRSGLVVLARSSERVPSPGAA